MADDNELIKSRIKATDEVFSYREKMEFLCEVLYPKIYTVK